MKKVCMALVVGLVLIGTAVSAEEVAGDLYVDGNLGVGTTSPSARMQVNGDALIGPTISTWNPALFQIHGAPRSNAFVVSSTNGGSEGGVVIKPNWAPGIASIQGTDSYLFSPAGLTINPEGGNVGIGTTTPNATLQVSGSVGIGSGIPQANKALCWTDAGTIGYCSSKVEHGGECTCHAIN